jgi:hypothetical protein
MNFSISLSFSFFIFKLVIQFYDVLHPLEWRVCWLLTSCHEKYHGVKLYTLMRCTVCCQWEYLQFSAFSCGRMKGAEYRVLNTECWVLSVECYWKKVLRTAEYRVKSTVCRVLRVACCVLRVMGLAHAWQRQELFSWECWECWEKYIYFILLIVSVQRWLVTSAPALLDVSSDCGECLPVQAALGLLETRWSREGWVPAGSGSTPTITE